MKEVVEKLINLNKTISTMESCTGGYMANAITNIEGSSKVFKFGAVTYSNEFKIKMGVDKDIIEKYSVYSSETARNMALRIVEFTNSDYGIGITGKLNRVDTNNPFGEDNTVYISIYEKETNEYYTFDVQVRNSNRLDNKKLIIDFIKEKLIKIIK